MSKIRCSKCNKDFKMPDGFPGRIICEDCDPFFRMSKMGKFEIAKPKFMIRKILHRGGKIRMEETKLQLSDKEKLKILLESLGAIIIPEMLFEDNKSLIKEINRIMNYIKSSLRGALK